MECFDCYQMPYCNQMTYCNSIYTCAKCYSELHIKDINPHSKKILFNYNQFVTFLRQQPEKKAKKYIIKYLLWVCSYNDISIYNKEYDKNLIQSYYDEMVGDKNNVKCNNFTLFCEYNID